MSSPKNIQEICWRRVRQPDTASYPRYSWLRVHRQTMDESHSDQFPLESAFAREAELQQ